MKPLIISRKTKDGFGGLNVFYRELSSYLGHNCYTLSPDNLSYFFKMPFASPSQIYLCDATLLPLGFLLKFFLRKPMIVSAHGLDIIFKNNIYQKMISKLLPQADAVILDSYPARNLLNKFNLKIPITVIPPGVTTGHLSKAQSVTLPLLRGKIVILSVGNLVKRKGHGWFVKNVMPSLPEEFIYFVVGNGPEKNNIESEIILNGLKKRVFILGQLNNNQLSYVFRKTDIYVSPNQHIEGNFESFGIAALEASAMGIPVVSSNVDGIKSAIKNGKNGIVIKSEANEFIKTIKNLADIRHRKKLAFDSKNYMKTHFGWDKTANAYSKVFSSLYKN